MKEIAEQVFQDEHRLTTRQRADQILRSLRDQHELLAVMPNGHSQEFGSMVLEVDAERGHLLLDVFTPQRPLAELREEEPFLCVARFRGIYVGFQVEALQAVDWKGGQAYKVAFPTSTYYLQRRQFYRVPAAPQDIGPVTLQRRGAAALQGICHDISAGGMRVLVPEPKDFDLHEGESLAGIAFYLRGQAVAVEAEVQHLGAPLQTRGSVTLIPLGLSFVSLPPAAEKIVVGYVQQRDRELLAER